MCPPVFLPPVWRLASWLATCYCDGMSPPSREPKAAEFDPLLDPPRTLEQLRAMEPGLPRVRAIARFIEQCYDHINEAVHLRYEDLAVLAAQYGVSEAARKTELSRSTVKTGKAVTQGKIGKVPAELVDPLDEWPDD